MSQGCGKNKSLKRRYYNVNELGSFRGVERLRSASKLNKKDVKQFLSGEDTYTIHKPCRKTFARRRVVVGGLNQQVQVDLVDMQRLKKHNNGISFLLTTIDPFSKYAKVYPLKNKTADSVLKAFKLLFKGKDIPFTCLGDLGKEFRNTAILQFLKRKNVKIVASKNEDVKMSIIERFNRTLKTLLFKYMSAYNTYKYIDVLPKIVNTYNKTFHRSIGMPPKDVDYSNQEDVWDYLYDNFSSTNRACKSLQVGDRVRISRVKKTFEKGFTPSWSRELFTVHKVHKDIQPIVFTIKDDHGEIIDGRFYKEELQKVNDKNIYHISEILKKRTRKGNKEYLVSWLGYDETFNSWVSSRDIVKYNK